MLGLTGVNFKSYKATLTHVLWNITIKFLLPNFFLYIFDWIIQLDKSPSRHPIKIIIHHVLVKITITEITALNSKLGRNVVDIIQYSEKIFADHRIPIGQGKVPQRPGASRPQNWRLQNLQAADVLRHVPSNRGSSGLHVLKQNKMSRGTTRVRTLQLLEDQVEEVSLGGRQSFLVPQLRDQRASWWLRGLREGRRQWMTCWPNIVTFFWLGTVLNKFNYMRSLSNLVRGFAGWMWILDGAVLSENLRGIMESW